MPGYFDLDGPRFGPAAGGRAQQLVILLHGLGADGQDLIGLAPHWAQDLPHAAFAAPNAPFPCDMAPFGYQWFSVQDRSPEVILAGVRAAAYPLDAFIDTELERTGIGEEKLALVGFSQGTMMSLYVAPRRERQIAGVVGYSGRLIAPDLLGQEIRSRPPMFLAHGTMDEVVPFSCLAEAERGLKSVGIELETLVCPSIGHGIDPNAMARGGAFLRRVLG